MSDHLLTLLIFIPLLGAVLALVWPNERIEHLRVLAVGVGVVDVILAGLLYAGFDRTAGGYQFREVVDWITLSLGTLGTVSIRLRPGRGWYQFAAGTTGDGNYAGGRRQLLEHCIAAEGVFFVVSAIERHGDWLFSGAGFLSVLPVF